MYMAIVVCSIIAIKVALPSNYFELSLPVVGFICLQFSILLFIQYKRAKDKFIIKENSIVAQHYLSEQKIRFDEIEGYETHYWYNSYHIVRHILLKTNNAAYKSVKIYPSYKGYHELLIWIETNFTDLDKKEETHQWKKTLADPLYGRNPLERGYFVKRARQIADILNTSSVALFVILLIGIFFTSKIYFYLFIPCLLIPILAIGALFYFKGVIRIEHFSKLEFSISKKGKEKQKIKYEKPAVYSEIQWSIALPSIILALAVYQNYVFINDDGIWSIALIAALLLLLLCYSITKEFEYKKFKSYLGASLVLLYLFIYFHGSFLGLNAILDSSAPVTYKSVIINKRENKVKHGTDYHIYLKSTKLKKSVRIEVSEQEYESRTIDDVYLLELRDGFFNIQWTKEFF